jgi:hypothetical protein
MMADMVMSAVHSNDTAVRLKRRILLEYVAKAIYCADYPTYCLFFTTIAESESVLSKMRESNAPLADIEAEERHLETQKGLFKSAYKKPKSFSEIMRAITGHDEYVGLYRMPSAFVHGDPEGMRALMPPNEQGHAAPTISLSDDELNAMMVDVGANILAFCDIFIATFKPKDESLVKRSSDLNLVFNVLSLKHSYGRPAEGMKVVTAELEAARAAGRIR